MNRTGKILAFALTLPFILVARLDAARKKFEDVAKVSASVEPTEAKRGQAVTVKLKVELKPGWHTYPTNQSDPDSEYFVNIITYPGSGDTVPVGKLAEPKTPKLIGPKKDVRVYEGTAVWERTLVIRPNAKPGKTTTKIKAKIMVCDEETCLPPKTLELEVPLTISAAPAVPVDTRYEEEVKKATGSK